MYIVFYKNYYHRPYNSQVNEVINNIVSMYTYTLINKIKKRKLFS